jgi:hypothetical protein
MKALMLLPILGAVLLAAGQREGSTTGRSGFYGTTVAGVALSKSASPSMKGRTWAFELA